MVKVCWSHHDEGDASWELESDMRAKYPKLFLFELVSLNFGDEISLRGVECNTPEN